jgi:hypothetical protein
VYCNNSRLCGLKLETSVGPVLILNVYMPTYCGDVKSLELYIDRISNISALLVDCDAIHCLVLGDFNCPADLGFFNEFSNFATNNNLFMADLL